MADRYDFVRPEIYLARQEKERAMLRYLGTIDRSRRIAMRALDLGCGDGIDLAFLARCGFAPERLVGIDLLPASVEAACERAPRSARIVCGTLARAALEPGSIDLVLVSTVFSSILDRAYARELAEEIWRAVRVGGTILVYDFIVDNPRNADVRGVSIAEIHRYFPSGRLRYERLTLAPPIARIVARIWPPLYTVCAALPFARTHVLCRIERT